MDTSGLLERQAARGGDGQWHVISDLWFLRQLFRPYKKSMEAGASMRGWRTVKLR
jgi:hypothetical protein